LDEVTVASKQDENEILNFLERQGLAENAWLTWDVQGALNWLSGRKQVAICRRSGEITGTACIGRIGLSPSGWNPGYEYEAGLDALDHNAMQSITEALPNGTTILCVFFRSLIRDYFKVMPGASCSEGDLFFTVTPERFQQVEGNEIIELTPDNAGLFDGCERNPPDWERMGEGRMLGIARDGKAVCAVGVAPIGPRMPSGRRAYAISGLATEVDYRRQGLAKELVSYATEWILQQNGVPIYWTGPDNTASQSLCQGLGYQQYARRMTSWWRRERKRR